MFRPTLVLLAVACCALARPQHQRFPVIPAFPSPIASGTSNANVVKGDTQTPFGSSTLLQQNAQTGGQAANGGSNQGAASAGTQSFANPFGQGSQSQTNAVSNQQAGLVIPGLPFIPGFPQGTATGTAGGQATIGKTTGPDGSQTTITQLGVSAGGSASNGATSNNQASGSISSVDTPLGSQTNSNVNAQSNQNAGR